MIECIIFDCDGVLVDTEKVSAQLMVGTLNGYGIDIEISAYIERWSGKVFRDIFQHYLDSGQLPRSFSKYEVIRDLENQINDIAQPIENADSTVNWVAEKGLTTAVVSNSRLEQVKHALAVVGIASCFGKNIFSSEMVAEPKPSPMVYLHAMEMLGVPPGKCLVIEDSYSGASAALSAGALVIGFTGAGHIQSGHGQRLLDLGVSEICSDMKILPQSIEALL